MASWTSPAPSSSHSSANPARELLRAPSRTGMLVEAYDTEQATRIIDYRLGHLFAG